MKSFEDIALSAKFALSTAAATTASGFGYFIGLIPDDIGKFSSLLGAILTIVMLGYWKAQRRKVDLENKILYLQLVAAEREAAKMRRATDGKP